MTNAEAIQWLQLDIAMTKFDPSTGEEAYLNDDAKKTIEALDMAIAALRNEQKAEESLLKSDPDSVSERDVIYREAAIETTWKRPSYTDPLNVLTEVRDRIKALPPAQPEYTEQDVKEAYHTGFSVGMEAAQAERKTGKWIRNDNGTYSCGLCHAWIPEE